jgi:mRNA interferase RelE/StbE
MSGFKLCYHPDVLREDVRSIPVNMKDRIKRAIETRLTTEPDLLGQPLRQSLKGHRKIRVGDWRVIYKIDGSNVIILKIGNRKDVYSTVFKRI